MSPFPLVTAADEIRGLKPFLATEPHWLLIGFFALLGLAALAAAFSMLGRRPPRPPSKRPAVAAAGGSLSTRERLDALRQSGLIEQGAAAPFCDQLSEIMRDFLRLRFGLSSRRLTTSEIMLSLRQRAPEAVCREVEETLVSCDLVKFAKVHMDAMGLQQALTTAYLAVETAELGSARGEA